MEVLQAIFLGIVEGLTEFLPISSTGHLIVAEDLIGYKDTGKLFTIVIQMGAIAAVMWFYRRDLWRLIVELLKGDKAVRRFWLVWVVATIPAGLLGLLLEPKMDTYAVPLTVAGALILGGIAIWVIESYYHVLPPKKTAQLGKITIKQAVLIGLYQMLALVPGVSRSGATIMGGLLSGVDRVTATAFSFYLGIPVLLVAGCYKLATDDISAIDGSMPALIAGIVAAFITALLVIGWLLKYVSRHNFKPFAYYRIVLGLVLLALIAFGVVD